MRIARVVRRRTGRVLCLGTVLYRRYHLSGWFTGQGLYVSAVRRQRSERQIGFNNLASPGGWWRRSSRRLAGWGERSHVRVTTRPASSSLSLRQPVHSSRPGGRAQLASSSRASRREFLGRAVLARLVNQQSMWLRWTHAAVQAAARAAPGVMSRPAASSSRLIGAGESGVSCALVSSTSATRAGAAAYRPRDS